MFQGTASIDEILVVDEDPTVRDFLRMLFSKHGYEIACFTNGASLLAAMQNSSPVCVLLDVGIPGKTGIDTLKKLMAGSCPAPILVMSEHGDIPTAVDAIKNGAHDFIEKPFSGADVLLRVQTAIRTSRQLELESNKTQSVQFHFPGTHPLTAREQQVLAQILAGVTNREAAQHLGISHRTVELHRARIMEKLGAKNAADLTRIWFTKNYFGTKSDVPSGEVMGGQTLIGPNAMPTSAIKGSTR